MSRLLYSKARALLSSYANVNGTRLHYKLAGPAEAHPIVFIHGFSLDTRMWDPQLEAFSQQYRLLCYDLRGYGKSALPNPHTPYLPTDDLKSLLDYLSISQAHIVGLSLGAAIAIEFAFDHPTAVTSLVLADPVLWGFRWSEEYNHLNSAVWRAGANQDMESARAAWLTHPLFAPALQNPRSAALLTQIITDYSGWHWTNSDPARLPAHLAISALESLATPTFIVMGEHDLPDHHEIAHTLRSRLLNSTLFTIPGAGHMVNMEAPDAFNGAVLNFLAGR